MKSARYTIYLDAIKNPYALTRLIRDHKFRADSEGDIEILDTFWNFPVMLNHSDVVPLILAYVDLVVMLDLCNLEVVKLIREQYIDDAFCKT